MILASLALLLALETPAAPAAFAVTGPRTPLSWTPAAPDRPAGIPARWILVPARLWAYASSAPPADTLEPAAKDTTFYFSRIGPGDEPIYIEPIELAENEDWHRAPFGDNLLADPGRWRSEKSARDRSNIHVDYNRVDQLRLGASVQLQDPFTMAPRLGGRLEYATGRKRLLYGAQLEQPLVPPGRLALGVSMVRRTDHSDLQQVDDLENSLALLLGRQDYRDYFEREGAGVYLSWRVPEFSTVSIHARSDDYRSLGVNRGTRSWVQRGRTLRDNPPIDEGTQHSAIARLERLTQTSSRTRAGIYHWIELERSGGGLGGDFSFTRTLADVRSVLRLTPAATLSLRAVGGHTAAGELPRQRQFSIGGVDGLRAHAFSQFVGNQMLLTQAEYDVGLWRLRAAAMPGGLHALVFVDAGNAWSNAAHRWDAGRQQLQADGGFGLATADDALRIYFAKNLQKLGSDFVISMRLQRPF